ncbi:LPS assembly lipoprotein LptE [Pseudopontixanthobacter vadosimaris]|uniref:LPS assembly lipoprotein LptE n=1 Tax=Pseudopontixanthobacter vadosimaris TaxID=2726450 RepID=UPI0014733BCC|nr:LPS assembly lipoprotein LptE [Pseudopontixanthobacter vadosimaris]
MTVSRRHLPFRRLLLCLLPLALAGCGLQPMYAGGASGVTAQVLQSISVSPIPGRAGYLMQGALNDRLGIAGSQGAGPQTGTRYRLDVILDDNLEALGVLSNDTVGRERRSLRARYRLVDLAEGMVLLDATAGSDAGIDVVSSEYATIAAEQTALENLTRDVADRIVTRLALVINRPADASR